MKKILISIVTLIFAMSNYFGFTQVADSSESNFTFYSAQMDAYYDSLHASLPDSVNIIGYKTYERQKEFWSSRIHELDELNSNKTKYVEQISYYIQNPASLPPKNSTNEWEFLGPVGVNSHNQGIIVSLYINPSNTDIIYAGSNSSGLFKTIDGGNTWQNITDIIGMPGLGVVRLQSNFHHLGFTHIV